MTKGDAPAIIGSEQSRALLAEMGHIASAELAANWALEALAASLMPNF
jgi:hypothetical protein